MKDSYGWVSKELSDLSEEEQFENNLSEEMRGKIPPGMRKFIEERKNKKAAEENANLTPEEKLKKEEEDNAHMTPEERKKKEEEERNLANKGKYTNPNQPGQKLNETEHLSRTTEDLIGKNNLNRFQELSAENKESNQEFLDFMNNKQGTASGGAR